MAGISRRSLIQTAGLVAATTPGIGALAHRSPKRKPPNILFILADNYNPNVVGCAGHPIVKTPNIDRLAAKGTYFSNCYCGSPLCAPARASLISGMFPSDVDSWCNATPFQGQVPTWGHRLQEGGYFCKATGKMDLTGRKDLGFEQVETRQGHDTSPDVTAFFRRPLCYRIDERPKIDMRIMRGEHQDEPVTRTTLRFLQEEAPRLKQPWAMHVGYIGPLPGFAVEPEYAQMYDPASIELPRLPPGYLETLPLPWQATRAYKRIATPIPEERQRRATAAYYGNVTALDERIGRVLDQLERSGEKEDTIVIYTADHGRSLGEHGLWYHNEPTDHSSRVTLIISGPGFPKGMRIDTPVMHVDLFPTLLELAAVSIPSGLRGHSLLPVCQGRSGNHPAVAYSECHAEGTCTGSFVIRKGAWKYIYYSYYDDLIFNMEEDPEEMNNLIGTPEGQRASRHLHEILVSLVGDPDKITERAFARQEEILRALCERMSLQELLDFGFERRLGRGQAVALLRKHKG
ncbi:MAG: sulfatase-like hydrolase/transferase [Planctomycetota bacterium]